MKPNKRCMLAVLAIILAFNQVDRMALSVVLQDIKLDLTLSDTQLGVLTGIAFALFYSIMGIPIARWADRGNRVTIIALTTALWSAAVALCSIAGNFVQLLAIRIGVAVGEAGCIPPAHSLIADYFSRAERPRAVARYMLGVPLSVIIGYLVAGWLNEFYGWRMTFVLLGLPGTVLAALAWFTLTEPRQNDPAAVADRAQQPTFKEVGRTLWANRTFRHLLFGFSVAFFFSYGIGQWKAAFFVRSYGLETGELGTWLAAIYGVAGTLGTYVGGELAFRFAARRERLQLRSIALMWGGFGAISAGIYLSSSQYVAFALMALAAFGNGATNGPLFATIQTLVPERMRALSIALIYLMANLIGMGLGPLAVGMLSDAFRSWAGEESLRYALLALCPGYLWSGWHLWHAARSVSRDLAATPREPEHAAATL
jgi:MFS transporter, Spinster family, sphingosine-1-phosphate transporter